MTEGQVLLATSAVVMHFGGERELALCLGVVLIIWQFGALLWGAFAG